MSDDKIPTEVNDGLDRSIHVFMDTQSIKSCMLVKSELLGEHKDSDAKKYKDFVMTVDCTDRAVRWIMKHDQDGIKLISSPRYEWEDTSSSALINEWKIENGELQCSEEDKNIWFVLGFLNVRVFLQEEGFLAELRRLNNQRVGVIVSVKENQFEGRIVRGINRPDLPCIFSIWGKEELYRPYPDETMYQSTLDQMSVKEIVREAERGNPDCMHYLARAYRNGDRVKKNFTKSVYWWKRFSKTGNAKAQFNVGLHYAKGCGVERNFDKAAKWMKRAADNGYADADELFELYSTVEENRQKAEAGDPEALGQMSLLYYKLGFLPLFDEGDDYKSAVEWGEKAADKGDPKGMYYLAMCCERGKGTDYDMSRAVELFRKAADMGHAPSQWNSAVLFLNGDGVPRNRKKGLYWAYKAAEQGYELAIEELTVHGDWPRQKK